MNKNIQDNVSTFLDDNEKMRDFKAMTKDDFLKSYSYLTEEEYEATKKEYTKKEILAYYDHFVINYMNEEGIDKIENYIKSFLLYIEIEEKELVKKYGYKNIKTFLCEYEGIAPADLPHFLIESVDKLCIIKDFLNYCDGEEIPAPTTEDVDTYVAGCWYDIINDETIIYKNTFDDEMQNILEKFIDFINKK